MVPRKKNTPVSSLFVDKGCKICTVYFGKLFGNYIKEINTNVVSLKSPFTITHKNDSDEIRRWRNKINATTNFGMFNFVISFLNNM